MESTNISLFVLLGMAVLFVVLTVVSKRAKNAFLALRSDIRWKLGVFCAYGLRWPLSDAQGER